MNRSMAHQDAAGDAGAPLGIFDGETLITLVADAKKDPHGLDALEQVAAARGGNRSGLAALIVCHVHATVAAVDCTDCVPLDAD
jgi:hypothetical protein